VIAFIHVFKTAGTTITGILRRNFSYHHFDARLVHERPAITAAQLKRVQRFYPRILSLAGHGIRSTSDLQTGFPNIRFYTFLREPRRRLVSAYIFLRRRPVGTGSWQPSRAEIESDFTSALRTSTKPYCEIFGGEGTTPEIAIERIEKDVGFVGLMENFDASLALFRDWLGQPDFDPSYQRLNVAGKARERKLLDDRLAPFASTAREIAATPHIAALIEERAAPDMAVYRHAADVVWPRLQERHGTSAGPFDFERNDIASDTLAYRLYRNLFGRPFLRHIAGPPAFHVPTEAEPTQPAFGRTANPEA
jgi:hypothetical protein